MILPITRIAQVVKRETWKIPTIVIGSSIVFSL